MKIVLYDMEPWERETFEPLASDHEIITIGERLTAANADEHTDAEILSTFIYSDLSETVLKRFTRLKLIVVRSTGVDHVATDWCAANGVTVANVPEYGESTVAEHTMAMLLALAHRIVDAVDRTRRGDFSNHGLQGFDLVGRTMGIIGTGNIGQHTCRMAKGFGMEVIAFDVKPDMEAARDIGFQYVELDELLARADVVSLHVPGTRQTADLIGKEEFARMKDGVVLLNTARGTVVDIEALSEALLTGKVRAAGLDVLPEEPTIREEAETLRSVFSHKHDLTKLLAGHALLRLNNVLITPHNAFNTREAVQRILDTTRQNIEGFVKGQPINVVTDQ